MADEPERREAEAQAADPVEAAKMMSMMGNMHAMHEYATGKGWTEAQVATWLANAGNVNYVVQVGCGLLPPEPQEAPPPPPPEGEARHAADHPAADHGARGRTHR